MAGTCNLILARNGRSRFAKTDGPGTSWFSKRHSLQILARLSGNANRTPTGQQMARATACRSAHNLELPELCVAPLS